MIDYDWLILEVQFNIHTDKKYVERTYANLLDIFSYVGGLAPAVYMILSFVGSFFSARAMEAKLMRTIYFMNSDSYNKKPQVKNLLDLDQGIIGQLGFKSHQKEFI